jgi:hypothetical protein
VLYFQNVSKLHVVGEFRAGNGHTPPTTVVTQPETQPTPSREEMAIVASQQEERPSTNESAGYESMDSRKYEEVKPISAEKVNGNAQYENTNPRGESTGDNVAGYETMDPVQVVVEDHKYENTQPGNKPTGDSADPVAKETSPDEDSPRAVEVHQVLVHDDDDDDHHDDDASTHVNNAYESDDMTTAL